MGVRFKADTKFTLRAIPDAQAKVGKRQGALLRTIARRRIRRRKRASKPGESPTNREGQLKRFLFYAWDPRTRSVVVGPVALGSRPTVPGLLEFGGDRRVGSSKVRQAERPFMAPALETAKTKLPELWAGAIK